MKFTENLLLKLPEPTEFVLVEDLNENFTKIDTEIAKITDEETGVEAKLTQHLDENNTDAHKANQISITPISGMVATNVQTALQEVFQTGNNVKADVVAALLALDPTLPITTNSTWAEIETAIGQVSTGKKWASGNASSSSTNKIFEPTSSVYLEVNGIDFLPSAVIIYTIDGNASVAVYSEAPKIGGKTMIRVGGGAFYLTGNAKLSLGGFLLPVQNGNTQHFWVAYE